MDRDKLAAVVEEALEDLPEEFARHLGNVAVLIEDEPSADLLRSLGMNPRRDSLFGLYRGIPLDQRGATHGNTLPDTISISIGR